MAKRKPSSAQLMFDVPYTPAPVQPIRNDSERWEPGSAWVMDVSRIRVEVAAYRVFGDGGYLPYSELALLRYFGLIK